MATTTSGSTLNDVTQNGTSLGDKMVGGSGVASQRRWRGGLDQWRAGDDILNGGSGIDTVVGGSGADTLIYKAYENQWVRGGTFNTSTLQVSGGNIWEGTDQSAVGIVPTQTLTTKSAFTGSDIYSGGNSGGDIDVVQVWLSAEQLADTALMAEINYVRNTWLPAQQKNNQASNTEYQFKTINLKISQFELRDFGISKGRSTSSCRAAECA